jgi:hypothetical protein
MNEKPSARHTLTHFETLESDPIGMLRELVGTKKSASQRKDYFLARCGIEAQQLPVFDRCACNRATDSLILVIDEATTTQWGSECPLNGALFSVGTEGRCDMLYAKDYGIEANDDLERLSTEELIEWALNQDLFGTGAFVWDLRQGLDSGKKIFPEIDLSRKGPDELLSNLFTDDRPPLPGDRRRHGR